MTNQSQTDINVIKKCSLLNFPISHERTKETPSSGKMKYCKLFSSILAYFLEQVKSEIKISVTQCMKNIKMVSFETTIVKITKNASLNSNFPRKFTFFQIHIFKFSKILIFFKFTMFSQIHNFFPNSHFSIFFFRISQLYPKFTL